MAPAALNLPATSCMALGLLYAWNAELTATPDDLAMQQVYDTG
jgi:hypothetical protein